MRDDIREIIAFSWKEISCVEAYDVEFKLSEVMELFYSLNKRSDKNKFTRTDFDLNFSLNFSLKFGLNFGLNLDLNLSLNFVLKSFSIV